MYDKFLTHGQILRPKGKVGKVRSQDRGLIGGVGSKVDLVNAIHQQRGGIIGLGVMHPQIELRGIPGRIRL